MKCCRIGKTHEWFLIFSNEFFIEIWNHSDTIISTNRCNDCFYICICKSLIDIICPVLRRARNTFFTIPDM